VNEPATLDFPVLCFGKYKNQPISEVPRHYLAYISDWAELWPETRDQILMELIKRGLPFGAHKDKDLWMIPTQYLRFIRRELLFLTPPYPEPSATWIAAKSLIPHPLDHNLSRDFLHQTAPVAVPKPLPDPVCVIGSGRNHRRLQRSSANLQRPSRPQ
jgi:uncharacterized protein (DUF3820 family)